MYKNLLEIIVCPDCGEKLELSPNREINGEIIQGVLTCPNNHEWMVEEGIVNFKSLEQTMGNNWSEMYAQMDYEELDKLTTKRTPQIQLDGM